MSEKGHGHDKRDFEFSFQQFIGIYSENYCSSFASQFGFAKVLWFEKRFSAKLKFVNDQQFNSKLNMTFRALRISFSLFFLSFHKLERNK